MLTVSQTANTSGVTVRTLHHYHDIGLLVPKRRNKAGYRMYDRDDLERLQQILFWRELEFELSEIKLILDDPSFDRESALHTQRVALTQKAQRLEQIIVLVENAIQQQGLKDMTNEDLFIGFESPEYKVEAEEKWGQTEAWKTSRRRLKSLSANEREDIKLQQEQQTERLAQAYMNGEKADSKTAKDLAEQARLFIDVHFYACSHAFHVGLGEMYVNDPRFTDYYDRHAEGLARWFSDAISANRGRSER